MKVAFLTTDNRDQLKDYTAANPCFGPAPEALLEGFALLPDVEVHVVSCARQKMTSPEKVAPNIFFHCLHVPKIGWMRTLFQGCVRAVRTKLKEIQPDIVHGQGTEGHNALAAICSCFPNVVTIHGNMADLARQFQEPVGSYNWLAGKLETFALKRTCGVLCNSAFTEQLVKPRARRTWRVPNALRGIFFAAPPTTGLAGRCTLVSIGVIAVRKRQLELLDVANELRRQGFDFEFKFAGEACATNAYVSAFLERIKPLEREGIARYIGPRPGSELVQLFDQSAGMVHFSPAESFGLAVAEGLARDLKLFTARVGGVPDIAASVPGAELFDMGDWPGLTSAIARWIRSGFPRACGAGKVMRARYEPEHIALQHIEIYREVLGRAGPASGDRRAMR
ncbi:MAG: glycosyltransferase family 4 protein [Verrucomicrobiota bacterium]